MCSLDYWQLRLINYTVNPPQVLFEYERLVRLLLRLVKDVTFRDAPDEHHMSELVGRWAVLEEKKYVGLIISNLVKLNFSVNIFQIFRFEISGDFYKLR